MGACLAENTFIKLADGTQRRIDHIRIGDRVIGGNQVCQCVENIWKGFEEELIRLENERGDCILLTDAHPVLTADGWRRAADVSVGTRVCVEEGTALLTTICKKPYHSCVYNLDLSGTEEHSMVAGGFIVGDSQRQYSQMS